MRNHHAELAGLLYHIRRMLTMGLKACQVYTNLDKDWVVCGVVMHDMEKLNELKANEMGISSGYSAKGNLLGHLVMGAVELKERAEKAGLSEEKTVMLQHMIISHHYEPEFGSPIRPLFPEAELLHYLDMLDAKMYDFEAALQTAEPGTFTERVRTLDGRMLYRPTFEPLNSEDKK
jgi:3'-5' exoribonuclease